MTAYSRQYNIAGIMCIADILTPYDIMKESIKGMPVSEQTALFIEALQAYYKAQDAYLTAVKNAYGEAEGERIYNEKADEFKTAERVFNEGLAESVGLNISQSGFTEI